MQNMEDFVTLDELAEEEEEEEEQPGEQTEGRTHCWTLRDSSSVSRWT